MKEESTYEGHGFSLWLDNSSDEAFTFILLFKELQRFKHF